MSIVPNNTSVFCLFNAKNLALRNLLPNLEGVNSNNQAITIVCTHICVYLFLFNETVRLFFNAVVLIFQVAGMIYKPLGKERDAFFLRGFLLCTIKERR